MNVLDCARIIVSFLDDRSRLSLRKVNTMYKRVVDNHARDMLKPYRKGYKIILSEDDDISNSFLYPLQLEYINIVGDHNIKNWMVEDMYFTGIVLKVLPRVVHNLYLSLFYFSTDIFTRTLTSHINLIHIYIICECGPLNFSSLIHLKELSINSNHDLHHITVPSSLQSLSLSYSTMSCTMIVGIENVTYIVLNNVLNVQDILDDALSLRVVDISNCNGSLQFYDGIWKIYIRAQDPNDKIIMTIPDGVYYVNINVDEYKYDHVIIVCNTMPENVVVEYECTNVIYYRPCKKEHRRLMTEVMLWTTLLLM